MSEKSGFEFISAEKKYLLNKEDFSIRVALFVTDPKTVLMEMHLEFVEVRDDNEDFDIIDATFDVLDQFVAHIQEFEIAIHDPDLQAYVAHGQGTEAGDNGLFRILKAAGYPKEEIQVWIRRHSEPVLSEASLIVRASLVRLDRIYESE